MGWDKELIIWSFLRYQTEVYLWVMKGLIMFYYSWDWLEDKYENFTNTIATFNCICKGRKSRGKLLKSENKFHTIHKEEKDKEKCIIKAKESLNSGLWKLNTSDASTFRARCKGKKVKKMAANKALITSRPNTGNKTRISNEGVEINSFSRK